MVASKPREMKKGWKLGIMPRMASVARPMATTSIQNCEVCRASRRVRLTSEPAVTRPPRPGDAPRAPGAGGRVSSRSPSGRKPTSSGDRMMKNAPGPASTMSAMPMMNQASRQPTDSTSACSISGKMSGPTENPAETVACARPRRRTNHFGTTTSAMATEKRPRPPTMPKMKM